MKANDVRKLPLRRAVEQPLAATTATTKGSNALALSTTTTSSGSERSESCPFRGAIRDWLEAGRANGLSPRTLTDYQEKVFKFWWWWHDHTRYAETVGSGPQAVTVKHAREFVTYLRTPTRARWGITEPGRTCLKSYLRPVSPVDVRWYGQAALKLTYKDAGGRLGNELIYRNQEDRLEIVVFLEGFSVLTRWLGGLLFLQQGAGGALPSSAGQPNSQTEYRQDDNKG